jgi:hypothetical protein
VTQLFSVVGVTRGQRAAAVALRGIAVRLAGGPKISGATTSATRIAETLRVTPMEAGVTDHVWNLNEIIALLG